MPLSAAAFLIGLVVAVQDRSWSSAELVICTLAGFWFLAAALRV